VRAPVVFVDARWQPGRAALLGVVVVALLAVAVFAVRVAWARSDADGVVIAPGGGSRAGPSGISAGAAPVGVPPGSGSSGSPNPSPTSGSASSLTAGVVVVHVVGQVRRPGVLRLAVGARVVDALEAAGGPTRQADLARVNLARVVVDGEQLLVPAPGDPDPVVGGGSAGVPGPASPIGGGALVSLNGADVAALDTLPGVGPVIAQRIVEWRTEHGRFTAVDELAEVSGIGEKLLAQVRPLVTL
jgi:competence protein ComEA